DPPQRHTRACRPGGHQREVALWYRPWAVVPPVGTAPRDRGRQRDVDVIGRVPMKFDGGQMVRFVGIRHPMDLGLPSERRECDYAVVQRRATAEQEVS